MTSELSFLQHVRSFMRSRVHSFNALRSFATIISVLLMLMCAIITFDCLWLSLRVSPSVKDGRVYAILVAKSLLPYFTSVLNFWNVIYAKLFVK